MQFEIKTVLGSFNGALHFDCVFAARDRSNSFDSEPSRFRWLITFLEHVNLGAFVSGMVMSECRCKWTASCALRCAFDYHLSTH